VRTVVSSAAHAHHLCLPAGESIYGKHFKDEIVEELKFSARGIVGMANKGPGRPHSAGPTLHKALMPQPRCALPRGDARGTDHTDGRLGASSRRYQRVAIFHCLHEATAFEYEVPDSGQGDIRVGNAGCNGEDAGGPERSTGGADGAQKLHHSCQPLRRCCVLNVLRN